MYASGANPGHRTAKTLNASHVAPVAVKAPNPSHLAPALRKRPSRATILAVSSPLPAKAPNPVARGISASAAHPSKPAGNFPVAAGYGAQGKYLPTAYYGGPGGYGSPRR